MLVSNQEAGSEIRGAPRGPVHRGLPGLRVPPAPRGKNVARSQGVGRRPSFHDAGGGGGGGGEVRANCQPPRRPPPHPTPAAQLGPLGRNFRPGIDYNPPLPRSPRPPGPRGAREGGWAVMRPGCAPGGQAGELGAPKPAAGSRSHTAQLGLEPRLPSSSSAEETRGGVGAPEAASPRHRRPSILGRVRGHCRGRGLPGWADRAEAWVPRRPQGGEASPEPHPCGSKTAFLPPAWAARLLRPELASGLWPALRRGRSLLPASSRFLLRRRTFRLALGPLLTRGPHLRPLSVSPRPIRPRRPSWLIGSPTPEANPGSPGPRPAAPPAPPFTTCSSRLLPSSGLCPPQCWGFFHPKPQEEPRFQQPAICLDRGEQSVPALSRLLTL